MNYIIFATVMGAGVRLTDDEAADREMRSFEFPDFGVSPGPTPSPSTPSMCTPTSCNVSEVNSCVIFVFRLCSYSWMT